jgi:hypothetical protein
MHLHRMLYPHKERCPFLRALVPHNSMYIAGLTCKQGVKKVGEAANGHEPTVTQQHAGQLPAGPPPPKTMSDLGVLVASHCSHEVVLLAC